MVNAMQSFVENVKKLGIKREKRTFICNDLNDLIVLR
jgi:hypothetical protein